MAHTIWPPNGHLAQFILDQFPAGYQGWGVDVGASDGISINTTFPLEASHRWTILSVEANPDFAPMLRKHRARVEMCACSSEPNEAQPFHIHNENPESFSALKPTTNRDPYPTEGMTWKKVFVPVRTVDELLVRWEFPQLDLLCADTEGTELDVLKGCDLARWKPRVVVTECWERVGPIDPYLEALGYKKTARSVHNDVFVMGESNG